MCAVRGTSSSSSSYDAACKNKSYCPITTTGEAQRRGTGNSGASRQTPSVCHPVRCINRPLFRLPPKRGTLGTTRSIDRAAYPRAQSVAAGTAQAMDAASLWERCRCDSLTPPRSSLSPYPAPVSSGTVASMVRR
ncbi:hypothetical protein Trydic_g3777 [Trypoxylus dichotomus]